MTQVEKLIQDLEEKYKVNVQEFLKQYKEGTSREDMAGNLGCSEWCIRLYASTLNLRLPKKFRMNDFSMFLSRFDESAEQAITHELTEAEENLDLLSKQLVKHELTIKRLQSEVTKYKKTSITTGLFEEVLESIKEYIPETKTNSWNPVLLSEYQDYTQFIVLSDLHFEECISRDDVGNANEFNWEIAESRLQKVFDELIKATRGEKRLVVLLLGDMINGVIHGAEAEATKQIGKAVVDLAKLLSDYLNTLSGIYEQVDVHCVHGNHGRLQQEIKSHSAGFNFEHMMYQMIASMSPTVTMDISTTGFTVFEVGGKHHLGHHGDFFRSGADFLKIREICRQSTGVVPFNMFNGHTHNFGIKELPENAKQITNGMLTGVNAYSHTNGFVGLSWSQTIGAFNEQGLVDYIKAVSNSW